MISFKSVFSRKKEEPKPIPNSRFQVAAAGNRADRKEAADWVGKREVKRPTKLGENEVAVNAAGPGAVAGIGIGPQGEPGVPKKGDRRRGQPLLTTSMLRRRGQGSADQ